MDQLMAVTLRALMIRRNWIQYQNVISEDTFSNQSAAAVYSIMEELHGKGNSNLSQKSMLLCAESRYVQAQRRAEITNAITSIMEVNRKELARAESSIKRFAARALGEQAVQSWLAHSNEPDFDYALPAGLMVKAQHLLQAGDTEAVAARAAGLPGDDDMARRTVALGLSPELDDALDGGSGCGELVVMLAPPKRGKTSYLIACATNAAAAGEHVLYLTGEISKRKVMLRYYQTLARMTYGELLRKRDKVDKLRNKVAGELYVVDYSMSRLTPSLVNYEVEQARSRGWPISYVVVDYMELMEPDGGFGRGGANSRSLGDMVKDLRRVAVQLDLPLLSAWQVNRGGVDKYVFTTTDISESWEVVKHADIILGLNQGPQELANNVMRLKVLEQRESPKRPLIMLHSDMTRNIIMPLEGSKDSSDGTEEPAAVGKKVSRRNRSRTRVHSGGTDG